MKSELRARTQNYRADTERAIARKERTQSTQRRKQEYAKSEKHTKSEQRTHTERAHRANNKPISAEFQPISADSRPTSCQIQLKVVPDQPPIGSTLAESELDFWKIEAENYKKKLKFI